MGHLAQRYLDASRSGVYRVSDAEVPGRAAIEAGSTLTRVAVADAGSAYAFLEMVLAERGPAPRVLIIDGADTLAAERAADFSALVAA
ncbi:MAG TPA: hypothetical protein VMN03_09945, partial [Burkholderiales bacterium]|nr:hypothetical protein [Burkholderiales bacterium]